MKHTFAAPSTERFIEEMGLIAQEHGDSRISGRIMGLLVVEGRELSLTQISTRLGVSRASVSTNARQLARRGVIRLMAHAGDRQDYYELSDLRYFDMLDEIARQFERHAQTIRTCVEAMAIENAQAAERAANVQVFFRQSAEILGHWAQSLQDNSGQQGDEK